MSDPSKTWQSVVGGCAHDILTELGVVADVNVLDQDGDLWIEITSPDSALLIGWRGTHLAALEHLVRVVAFAQSDATQADRPEIYLDIEGYKRRQVEKLEELGRRIAAQVQTSRQAEVLQPMTSFERRIIHAIVTDIEDVETESLGEGPNRRVMVKYVGS